MGGTSRIPQVLIVGAGIAGLAAAGAIRELGWDVDVVEQGADFDGAGTGLFFPANGVRALAALGVLDGVACRGRRIGPLQVRSADGAAQAAARLDLVWPAVGPSLAVHRPLAQQALLEAALVPVRMGTRLTGIATEGTRVRAIFGDGGTASYDLVVGADGRAPRYAACCGPARPPATAASRGGGAS